MIFSMVRLSQEERKILQSCCNEFGVNISEIEWLMDIQSEYQLESRRSGIDEKIKNFIDKTI